MAKRGSEPKVTAKRPGGRSKTQPALRAARRRAPKVRNLGPRR